jgi:hypothetical protein
VPLEIEICYYGEGMKMREVKRRLSDTVALYTMDRAEITKAATLLV